MAKKKSEFQKTLIYKWLLAIYDVMFGAFIWSIKQLRKIIQYFL